MSRAGYRALLEGGVRIFEWNGVMLHAKTAVADGRWARVGSTNANITSWFGNWELDVAIEDQTFGAEMQSMFLQDLENSTEVVLKSRSIFTGTRPAAQPEHRAMAQPRPHHAARRRRRRHSHRPLLRRGPHPAAGSRRGRGLQPVLELADLSRPGPALADLPQGDRDAAWRPGGMVRRGGVVPVLASLPAGNRLRRLEIRVTAGIRNATARVI